MANPYLPTKRRRKVVIQEGEVDGALRPFPELRVGPAVAIEKIVAGMIQAIVAGLVVIPLAWLVMGSGVDLRLEHLALFTLIALLVAFFSAAGGLTLGCSVSAASRSLLASVTSCTTQKTPITAPLSAILGK